MSFASIDDLPPDRLGRAMALRNGLVALCEGKSKMDNIVYWFLRREFMSNSELLSFVPQFVRATQDTDGMWVFLKDCSPHWAPRRQFVREQFAALIDKLESTSVPAELAGAKLTESPIVEKIREIRMYNLFVSAHEDDWAGEPWIIEISRCVNEYTGENIRSEYGGLTPSAIEELQRMPCIFAYESSVRKDPKFGVIQDIVHRQGRVRVEYRLISVDPFLSHNDLSQLQFELDISDWELNRTHWAVKQVNLPNELRARGITLPNWVRTISRAVNLSNHQFEVALSFPGEVRSLVEEVAAHLEQSLGANGCFTTTTMQLN